MALLPFDLEVDPNGVAGLQFRGVVKLSKRRYVDLSDGLFDFLTVLPSKLYPRTQAP